MKSTDKTRYSDSELEEFKGILLNKLGDAKSELRLLLDSLATSENSHKIAEAAADNAEKEYTHHLAGRQRKFIEQLEAALVRIENKTYGICRETGTLIQKERLLAVPHTTLCMAAKRKFDAQAA